MYGITDAVDDQIRQAKARYSNFENGMAYHGDSTSTEYFERIASELEDEAFRVREAMKKAVEDRRQAMYQATL